VLDGSSGLGETYFYPDPDSNAIPGNDQLPTLGHFGINTNPLHFLGNQCTQWRTVAHELGHTLGLRHGGVDHTSNKGAQYLSLMSYSWQLDCNPTAPSPVQSYSGAGDPTFNDWANLNLDFADYYLHLGNTLNRDAGVITNTMSPDPDDVPITTYPSLDLQPPAITITQPGPAAYVVPGAPLTVAVSATDNYTVSNVLVQFDSQGIGAANNPTETVTATQTGPDTYSALFPPVAGPDGPRLVRVLARHGTLCDRSPIVP